VNARRVVIAVAIAAVMAGALLAMGREPWCTCGYVKLWHGITKSAENSQHLTDWYTFTHLLHGFGFYWLLFLVARPLPIGTRFLIAAGVEAAWEVLENTPLVIERYRAGTIALDYYGDSVVNSLGDLATEMAGFGMAAVAPAAVSVALFVALELLLAYAIRDNLTLNIVMLIRPIEAIKEWQTGK